MNGIKTDIGAYRNYKFHAKHYDQECKDQSKEDIHPFNKPHTEGNESDPEASKHH